MKVRFCFVALSLIIAAQAAGLAQRRSIYQGFGDFRNMSCLSWTPGPLPGEHIPEDWRNQVPVHAWIYGYLAGGGYMPSPVFGERMTSIDVQNVDAWMDRYCGQHRGETIENALKALTREFDARR
jgi:hypothetical protein